MVKRVECKHHEVEDAGKVCARDARRYSSDFSCCSSVGSSSLTGGWMGIARESMV